VRNLQTFYRRAAAAFLIAVLLGFALSRPLYIVTTVGPGLFALMEARVAQLRRRRRPWWRESDTHYPWEAA
jgi:hypothetical protein